MSITVAASPRAMPLFLAACTLSALSLLPAAPAHAERLVLDPVTVTATRYERPLSGVPASVTVLEGRDLAAWAGSPLEDILATGAGVTLARSGGPGQQTSVFLRGSNSDSVLVLVDGVKFNGGTFGGANLQNLRGADIARIEIVRGPRSTLYGSEAIGGVISITTRHNSNADDATQAVDTAKLRASGGSDRSSEYRASASHDAGDDHLALAIGTYRTDGDPVTDRTTIEGEHRNTSGTVSAATRRGNTRYGVDGWAGKGSTRYVDCVYVMFVCVDTIALNQAFTNSVTSLWSETTLGDHSTLRARIGHAADEIDQQESADFARTARFTGSLDLQQRSEHNTLVIGIDAEREDVDAVIYAAPIVDNRKNHALFLRNDLMLGAHQLGLGLRATEYDSFGSENTGEASYGLRIGEAGYAWLAWGRAFRAPDASERFAYGGNPFLEPEKSESAEAGLRWRFGRQVVTATGFVQTIEDLIDYPPPAYSAVNIAEARITGTELGWSWQGNASRIEVFATLQDAVDDSTGQRLARRPEQQLSATARHRIGTVELHAGLLAMDARDNSAFDAVTLPGFAVFNLGAEWTATPGLVLDARVENAGDIDYALASGSAGDYLMPDRAFLLGIEWRGTSRYRR
ncbi:MAG: TonB-dependent receptor domain-containing protein [Pseudomonadota bacterium]